VVNRAFTARFFPGGRALGRVIEPGAIALGASRTAIIRLIGGWAATLVLTGLGAGILGLVPPRS